MFTKRTIAAGLAAAMLATGFVAQTTVPAAAWSIPVPKVPVPQVPKLPPSKPKLPPLKPLPWKPIKLKKKHHHHWGEDFAAGAAGFMIGAAMASSARAEPAEEPYYAHVRRCEARYRTYDVETDSFMGYDGLPHRCRL